MSTTALYNVWSLAAPSNRKVVASSATPSPITDIDQMFLDDILMTRVIQHHLSNLIAIVPPGEARLVNEGLIPIYTANNHLLRTMKDLAHGRGITVPAFPEAEADYKKETATDPKRLKDQLFPHMAESTRKYVEQLGTEGKHWASYVASISVLLDMFLDELAAAKVSTKNIGSRAPETYSEVLATDRWLAPYSEVLLSEELRGPGRVLSEEILIVRSAKGETGWKEEEAKEITETQLALVFNSFPS